MRSQKILWMTETALMSAVLCIVAPFAIPVPISPVPISLATFVVYLTAALLGAKKGTISVFVYLLLGMAGLPVFSGFSGGMGVLIGPTGGYLLGYPVCAAIVGWLTERKKDGKVAWNILAMILGTVACYGFGTAWFLESMEDTYTLAQALVVCVVPYLIFDVIKIIVAAAVSAPVRKLLRRIEQ